MTSRRVLALIAFTFAGFASGSPSPADPPVSQREDESRTIVERIRLYRERHGVGGELDSEQMLERTRWGYERWLKSEHRRIAGTGEGVGWVSLGPSNGAGRMTALAPHPSDDGTVLAGAASGGVWKTTDHGLSWRPLTDGLSDLSVGAVAYAPSDPQVVYIGSGEGGLGSFFVPGIGLVRSSDGGETWFVPSPGEIVAEQFFALSVDPRDEERLLAATERGLFSTADGGVTWALRLGHPDLYGVTEILRSPEDPDRLWAALWCFSHCPAPLARVMTSPDAGISWEPSATGLPDALLNNPNANRIAIAVAPSDADVLYTSLNTNRYTPVGPEVAIFRSSDGGSSWSETSDPGPYLLNQGWYDNAIVVDPTNPDGVVAAGVWYVRTADGGATWTTMDPISGGDWMGTETLPHVDGHALAWQQEDLWLGCDGGVWVSGDGGVTWEGRNRGLVTRQYYGLDIDPIRPERILGGTQDNKTNLRLGPDDGDWEWVLDGDGFECAVNPLVPDLVYGTIYGTLVFASVDGGLSWRNIAPSTGGDLTPFDTPLTMRSDLPWHLFTGSSRVWHSRDAGSSWRDLGTEVTNGEWSIDAIRSIAVTPADHDYLMIGKGWAIYTSSDAGSSWRVSEMTTYVNSTAISPFAPELGLAGLARVPPGEPQLLRTTDGGLSWHPADNGLPPFAVQVVRWHPLDADVAFAGTDVGLFRSSDRGLTWTAIGDGLPAASVHDLRIADDGSRVVVATHGRGIWELGLAEPVGEAPSVSLDGPELAFIGDAVVFDAVASDPDGDDVELRWLSSDDWRLIPGGAGNGTVSSSLERRFGAGGQYLVAANAVDATGRTGFDSLLITAYEPGDDCSTPRLIPGDGPFPHTILTENHGAALSPDDPEVGCTSWSGDRDSGRWASIWLEFTPAQSGSYTFSTCGSVPDTVLSAWTGPACGPYAAVDGACNDDDELVNCVGRDTDSWLELELEAGATVRILLGATEEDETGDLRITVDCPSCLPPPADDLRIVAAAARTPGSGDSFWTSGLQLVNTGAEPAATEIRLLPGSGSSATVTSLEVQPGMAISFEDVVGELTGRNGAGALQLSSSAPLSVASRTATTGAGGSFGQGIPAVFGSAVAFSGTALRLIGLAENDAFRTNIGLVNLGADTLELTLSLYDGETNKLAEEEHRLEPGSWRQLNRVFQAIDGGETGSLAVVRQRSVDGRFLAYASVVEEGTGDPTFIAPTDIGRVGDALWIPAAAHTDGIDGVRWRTDLTLFNPGSGDLITRIELVGPEGPVSETTVHLPEGWALTYPDVVADKLGAGGSGALRIDPSFGLAMATSRTYAVTVDGSYGQGIPGMASGNAITGAERAFLPGLRQDDEFRTNLGLVNTGPGAVSIEITAHDIDGEEVGSVAYHLEGRSWFQANQPLPTGTAYAVVTSATPGAEYLAYASVVDRATDDPTYIAAVRAANR
jgi:photosystem II stability/assembly factor-like uncharacterized protein